MLCYSSLQKCSLAHARRADLHNEYIYIYIYTCMYMYNDNNNNNNDNKTNNDNTITE